MRGEKLKSVLLTLGIYTLLSILEIIQIIYKKADNVTIMLISGVTVLYFGIWLIISICKKHNNLYAYLILFIIYLIVFIYFWNKI